MKVNSQTILIGGAVLVVVLAIALSQGSPTRYSPAVGSDAGLYATASANYQTAAEQDRMGRADAINALVGYASDRFNHDVQVLDITQTNETARYGIDSNERLSKEQIATMERMHREEQITARNESNNNFWSGVWSFLGGIGTAIVGLFNPAGAAVGAAGAALASSQQAQQPAGRGRSSGVAVHVR